MGDMKYKAGDRVRIKSLDWYNNNKNNNGIIVCGSESFTHPMSYFCNKVVNIITIQNDCYRILEDDGDWYWTNEMIEGLAEEETKPNYHICNKCGELMPENGICFHCRPNIDLELPDKIGLVVNNPNSIENKIKKLNDLIEWNGKK